MKEKLIKFSKKPFVRNVILLASGTAMAQVIAMILSPIITRLYGPEAFGLMGTFMAVVSIVAPIAALTYPIAIVLPKRDQDAKGLIRLSLVITTIVSIISLVILLLFNKQIINIFNIKEIEIYLYLIPLIIIFSGLMQVAEQWLIRTKQFSINARVTVLQSIVINGSKVGIGLFYPIAAVLVVLSALANGLKAALMIFFAKRSNYEENKQFKDEKTGLKGLAKAHNDFPKYRAPEVFINSVSQNLPVLMLTAFFGPASAGFYAIGRTVLRVPSTLIGNAVGDVFYPRIAQAATNKEDLTAIIKKGTLALAGVGIFPYGLIILFGPFLFSFVFGSDWVTAGEYARWIALGSYFGFINKPSVKSLPVLSAQRFQLIYTIFMLLTRIGVLAIGFYVFASDQVAVALFGLSGAVLNIGLITITLKISRKKMI
ncbi:MAG TPA: oligosaccharide flippase family protein [Pseudogracilibacillus sp.]|nr:oligosaccharide flippase family protein [Pseudogracilibacillus sp.]